MTTNQKEITNGCRRIKICGNQIQIDTYHEKTDCETNSESCWKKTFKEIHERVFGKHHLAECKDEDNTSIFSINEALEICKVPVDAKTEYCIVHEELFVKVTDGSKQCIYDDAANLIQTDKENHLFVVFKGTEVVIEKKSKENDRKTYYNFEGYRVS